MVTLSLFPRVNRVGGKIPPLNWRSGIYLVEQTVIYINQYISAEYTAQLYMYRGRILGYNWNKSLKSFLQSPLRILQSPPPPPKGVGSGTTLAWPGWKQPDIPVEVGTVRVETSRMEAGVLKKLSLAGKAKLIRLKYS
jgi:hypothetical protein